MGRANADPQKIGDLFGSFMDTERIEGLGTRPIEPLVTRWACATPASRGVLGEFERIGGRSSAHVNTDDRNPTAMFYLVQGGLGLPDESTTATRSRRDPRGVRRT